MGKKFRKFKSLGYGHTSITWSKPGSNSTQSKRGEVDLKWPWHYLFVYAEVSGQF